MINTTLLKKIEVSFKENFSGNLIRVFSPGRINLIGEHIDYNGGKVFPCALDFGTYAVVTKREDNKFRVFSKNFENIGTLEFSLNNLILLNCLKTLICH